MGENARANGNHEVALNVKDIGSDNPTHNSSSSRSVDNNNSTSCISIPFLQKVLKLVLFFSFQFRPLNALFWYFVKGQFLKRAMECPTPLKSFSDQLFLQSIKINNG